MELGIPQIQALTAGTEREVDCIGLDCTELELTWFIEQRFSTGRHEAELAEPARDAPDVGDVGEVDGVDADEPLLLLVLRAAGQILRRRVRSRLHFGRYPQLVLRRRPRYRRPRLVYVCCVAEDHPLLGFHPRRRVLARRLPCPRSLDLFPRRPP